MFTSPPIGRFPANPVRAVEDGLGEILAQRELDQRHPLLVAGHRRMRARHPRPVQRRDGFASDIIELPCS